MPISREDCAGRRTIWDAARANWRPKGSARCSREQPASPLAAVGAPALLPIEVVAEPGGKQSERVATGSAPVRSLRYFASLVEEVRAETFPDSYRQHL